jgi:hypothetical protein
MYLVSVFYRYIVFPATLVEGSVFSPFYVLGTFVKNQVDIVAKIYTWVFYSVPFGFHAFFCASTMLFLLLWFCYSLKWGIVIPPALLFFLSFALGICSLLCFHMKIRVDFSISVMNVIGILMEISLNL